MNPSLFDIFLSVSKSNFVVKKSSDQALKEVLKPDVKTFKFEICLFSLFLSEFFFRMRIRFGSDFNMILIRKTLKQYRYATCFQPLIVGPTWEALRAASVETAVFD
jgi:hypothetical protein